MFIRQNQALFSIQRMCKILGVSRAGFYAWLKCPESQLRPKMRKRFKATTDSKHSKPVAENYLARKFSANGAKNDFI